jgi:plasmid stability protein
VQVKVRMPKELQRKIQREADRHGQTINAEILTRLVQSFETEKTPALRDAIAQAMEQKQTLREELTKQLEYVTMVLAHHAERPSDAELQRRKDAAKKFREYLDKTDDAQLEKDYLKHKTDGT